MAMLERSSNRSDDDGYNSRRLQTVCGQPAQTASTTDNVIDAHFHQAPSNANGPVRFGWRTHDVNDGDAVDDEFTATGLALSGLRRSNSCSPSETPLGVLLTE